MLTPVRSLTIRPPSRADRPDQVRNVDIHDPEKNGIEVKTVAGAPGESVCASYTLAPDDLYVRARIEEPGQPLCTAALHPQGRLVAWTQPYARGERGEGSPHPLLPEIQTKACESRPGFSRQVVDKVRLLR